MNTKDKILKLMGDEHLCILSTLGPDGEPQSAVVGFSEDEQVRLVVGTSNRSRKFKNILIDPRVSLVIGWDNRKTIQYEGQAHEARGEECEKYQKLHAAKHPNNAKYKDIPDETYIIIEPAWVRYTDASIDPWQVEELREFS